MLLNDLIALPHLFLVSPPFLSLPLFLNPAPILTPLSSYDILVLVSNRSGLERFLPSKKWPHLRSRVHLA